MKKKILGIAVMATVALAAGWNINQSNNDIQLSDLAVNNVEALASGESDLCPNGWMDNGGGCHCNGWYPSYREA